LIATIDENNDFGRSRLMSTFGALPRISTVFTGIVIARVTFCRLLPNLLF
jgi:hypothetical protein